MLRNLFLAVAILTGCSSLPTPKHHELPRLLEPVRSHFVVNCMMQGGLPVTVCLCFEEFLVKMHGTNIDNITQLDMAVAQQKCMAVLKPFLDKELESLVKQQLEKERKESI